MAHCLPAVVPVSIIIRTLKLGFKLSAIYLVEAPCSFQPWVLEQSFGRRTFSGTFLEAQRKEVAQGLRAVLRDRRIRVFDYAEHDGKAVADVAVWWPASQKLNDSAAERPDVGCWSRSLEFDHLRCHCVMCGLAYKLSTVARITYSSWECPLRCPCVFPSHSPWR